MHNIDRTVGEYSHENFEFGHEFGNEYENYESEGGYSHEYENYEGESYEGEMNEMMEEEMTMELLSVTNEQELEQFLGKLLKKAAGGLKSFAGSSLGKTLIGGLKGIAKKALPLAGSALGGMFGGPIGAKLGGMAAGGLGKMFGLELEGLSAEDREYEISRAYVRFANNAARRAVRHPMARRNPALAVRQSITSAASTHAPGLLMPSYNSNNNSNNYQGGNDPMSDSSGIPPFQPAASSGGRWVRRGNSIIIYNVY